MSGHEQPIYLTGPTASGKTALGLELAERFGAEIVSLDSMALYRRLDIGTAKPTAEERARVPHHLVDIIEPSEGFSQAEYVAAAERVTQEICERGRRTLFVGGTPLYLKSLLRGICTGPAADWALRARWATAAAEESPEWLHAQVARIDPQSAARLHPRDTRRLIRALEVFELTGQPISELQQQFDRARPAAECRVFVLDWPREVLYRRINDRVSRMFELGLVDEVRQLLAEGVALSRTARQAVGYREVLDHLAGQHDLRSTIELVQQHTRQFARRQLTWFRSLSECRWLDAAAETPAELVARMINENGRS